MIEYGWKEYRLGDIAELFDGPHATPKKTLSGPVFLGISSLNRGTIDESQFEYISESDYELWTKRIAPKEHDIVFSYETKLGEAAIIPKGFRCCLGRRLGLLRVNDKLIDPHFLLYYYLSPIFQAVIHERTIHGTTVDRIPLLNMPRFPVIVPPLPEQRAIASVLSSLDDKIDLLHRQNKTLESMAETLFRQWFVEEADEEWEETKLGEIITVVSGTTPKTENPDFWNGEYHWTSPRDITNLNGLFLFNTERKITKKGLEQIGSGLLPEQSLLMSSRAPVGALAFAEIPVAINQGYAGIICDKGFSREFIYLWLKTNMEYIQSHANGSTFQEISKSSFKALNIIVPDKRLYTHFQSQVLPIFEKVKKNSVQIRALESLRDTLLPKLMSGEVKVEV